MPESMTRSEHIAWCKQRALECVDRGKLDEALASMLSDLRKHPETVDHVGGMIGVGMAMLENSRLLRDSATMRHWIEGFN